MTRRLPSRAALMICGDGGVISALISPVRKAIVIGASPLYGICVMRTPASCASIAAATWP